MWPAYGDDVHRSTPPPTHPLPLGRRRYILSTLCGKPRQQDEAFFLQFPTRMLERGARVTRLHVTGEILRADAGVVL